MSPIDVYLALVYSLGPDAPGPVLDPNAKGLALTKQEGTGRAARSPICQVMRLIPRLNEFGTLV